MNGARRRAGIAAASWTLFVAGFCTGAVAQQSDAQPRASPVIEFPNLGPIPGGSAPALGTPPGSFQGGAEPPGVGVLGNRKRGSRISRPGAGGRGQPLTSIARRDASPLPEPLPAPPPPARRLTASTAALLDVELFDDEGPADGLTFDAAIERMMAANLDIRALRQELPQADADILTAGLRTNPLIYIDSQFIPYGTFSPSQPGGPTQYDVNITYPLDVSQKRQARMVVARLAKSTLEAQFQDVVRRQIGNLSAAFVGLQSARLAELAAVADVRRREALVAEARRGADPRDAAARDAFRRESLLLQRSQLALVDAAEAVADAQEGLAVLLNEPPGSTGRLQPRGGVRDTFAPPPPLDELTKLALTCRPDVQAMRVGVSRANAEVNLQRANRFDDVFLFYDPITIQDNSPFHSGTARSWAVGVTCALPIYNRNQGNIARAASNVQQTRQELASLERRVVSEVRLAEREYQTSKRALEQIENGILPLAREALVHHAEQFANAEIGGEDFQSSQEEAAEIAQNYRDVLIRHRRAMLDLNTAVGLRILP